MTELKIDDLKKLQAESAAALATTTDAESLEAWRVKYLGRSGELPQLLRHVKDLSPADRQVIGSAANAMREDITQQYKAKLATLNVGSPATVEAAVSEDQVAVTKLMGLPQAGHLHPLTLTLRRINDIFSRLGFTLYEGPLVEEAKYNFDFLNIPENHPTRTETDTFFTTDGRLLRTQTSALQVRVVREQNLKPPFKLFFPGRVFRNERTDATHESTFHQFEGVVVNDNTTVADFKGVVEYFYSQFFGKSLTTRLRPGYFPFVEPGFEVDISCVFCQQKGCRICKYSGWIEVMGAGMIHPVVLNNMGIDPAQYQGYAFGGAVDRLTMLEYGINDIRLLWSDDLRFIQQFS